MFDISKLSLEQLVRLRKIIEQGVSKIDDDAVAVEGAILFPVWKPKMEYTAGMRVRYNEVLYKVLKDHSSELSLNPLAAPDLFAPIVVSSQDQ